MPRQRLRTRTQRERENADRLGEDYKFTRDPKVAAQRAEARRARAKSIPPSRVFVCAIRGCRTTVPNWGKKELVVCLEHATDIWQMVEDHDDAPHIFEAVRQETARRDKVRAKRKVVEIEAERKRNRRPVAQGDVYYARVGSLIKVGWTQNLYERIRSYGADAELLAHFPGTRDDEKYLHRNLRPSRAKGNEWYHDDPIIRAFIALVIRQHGPPRFTDAGWTRPKQVVAGKRHR